MILKGFNGFFINFFFCLSIIFCYVFKKLIYQ